MEPENQLIEEREIIWVQNITILGTNRNPLKKSLFSVDFFSQRTVKQFFVPWRVSKSGV